MGDGGRAAAAGGVLLLCMVAGAAPAQQRAPSTAGQVDTTGRRPASPERQAVPPRAPAGNAEHGRYLAHHVAMCVECHSPRDESGQVIPGQEFTGAPLPVRPTGPSDWALRAPRNRGLPGYTPELAIRLLTQGGVDRDGRQLRPPMPHFRMTVQDAADVVAYLKSLP
jgi:mono/diheme cytochrome c family protein